MGYIYRITNKVNGKVYVGQTRQEVRERWYQHKDPQSGCRKLRNAIQKYGADNFALDIICVCFDDDLCRFEMEYIKKYDSCENGYNCTPGGEGVTVWTDEMRKALSLKMTGRKLSAEHAAKNRGVNAPMYGRKHSEETTALMRQNNRQVNKQEVDQFTLAGDFVKRFESLTIAAAAIDVKKTTIMCACDRANGTSGGFRWKWVTEHEPPVKKPGDKRGLNFKGKTHSEETKRQLRLKSNWNGRKVDQFTFDGKFVKRFDCLRDAGDSINTCVNGIRDVCDGICKYAKAYVWRWVVDPDAPPQDIEPLTGVYIDKFTMSGEFVERFFRLKEAAASVKGHVNGVRLACDGKLKHNKGFLWRRA
jgi:group I intron endonuclease